MPNIELTAATSQQKKDILDALGAPQFAVNLNGVVTGFQGPDGTASSGANAVAKAAAAKPTSRTQAASSYTGIIATMTSPGYDGRSFQLVRTLEGHVVGLRVVIRNVEPTSYTLNSLIVAPSATAVTTNPAPTGAWVPATFGGSTSVTIPARLAVNRPSTMLSDWVPISTIARTDGYEQPYIFIRAYNATGPKSGLIGATSNPNTGGRALWGTASAANRGRRIITASAVGDFVSSNQAGMTDDSGNFSAFIHEVEALYTVPVLNVLGIGDSIMNGESSALAGCGYGFRACADLSTLANPIVWRNYGWSNMVTANFAARLDDTIAAGAIPNVVVFPAYSPNDSAPTAARNDAAFANMLRMLDVAHRNRIVPIIVGTLPRSYAAEESFRQAYLVRVADYCRANFIEYLNADGILVSTPGGNAQATALCDDQLHPNDAGHDALSNGLNGFEGLKGILSRIASAYFA